MVVKPVYDMQIFKFAKDIQIRYILPIFRPTKKKFNFIFKGKLSLQKLFYLIFSFS